MKPNIVRLCIVLLLFAGIITANASNIQVKTDEKGRKVFYNISRSFNDGQSQAIYYSRRAEDYLYIVEEVCSRHGVDTDLVKALIQVESNYDPVAVSRKGARGLMQLMPATAARYGVRKIFDPKENVEGGVKYLKDLLSLFNSNMELALAAYNAGEGAVQKFNGIPRYLETQNYVRKVLALYKGDPSYVSYSNKPRMVTYFKYVDSKGVTHYSASPISGVEVTKVSFYYWWHEIQFLSIRASF